MDIRSFFGGKPPASSGSSQKASQTSTKKVTPSKNTKKRKPKVIGKLRVDIYADDITESDEDDDEYSRKRLCVLTS
jgi:hypothetical protein